MKTLYSIILAAGIVGSSITSISQTLSFTNGMVAHFPFNRSATDVTGNGHNGTVVGAKLVTDRFGFAGGAYKFGEGAAAITVPLDSSIFAEDFTVTVWFKADTIEMGWPTLLSVQSDDSIHYSPFTLGINGLRCGCDYPGGINVGSTYASATFAWALGPRIKAPIGSFNQIVVTKSGSTVFLYVNSQLWDQGTVANSTVRKGSKLWIGRTPWDGQWDVPGTSLFHGILDDIRIYSRSLSKQEIKDLYHYELPTLPTIDIEVETVRVNMHVTPSKRYQLESSFDFKSWMKVDETFIAQTSEVSTSISVEQVGQFFRVYEVK